MSFSHYQILIMATKTKRYDSNPFLKDMLIPVGSKNVRITTLGKESNVLVNQLSGEVTGTHVVAHKRVDSERFVKTFSDYMAFTFELGQGGNRALRVVMYAMQEHAVSKDEVNLDKYTYEGFMEKLKKRVDWESMPESKQKKMAFSYATFHRGLSELEKAKIIAKTRRPGVYFINPNCMFNGDRIAFTTLLERDDNYTEGQGDLLNQSP